MTSLDLARSYLRVTSTAVVTLTLLGCGGGGDDASPTAPQPEAPAPQPDPPPSTSQATPLLFRSARNGGVLLRMSEDGRTIVKVAGPDAIVGDFSPDGSKIAYSELITATQGNIVVADSDGSNPIVVYSWRAPDERGGGLGAPAWSPDGLQIIFQIKQGFGACLLADTDFYVVGVDGTGFAKLLDSECGSGNFKPTYSPDGAHIAFSSKRARGGGPTLSDLDIFLMNADGSDVQQLSDGVDSGRSPVWAPDGNRILFGANTPAQLWVLDLEDGAGVPEMIFELPEALLLEPGAWSPDGSKVYLTVWWDGSGSDVHVLDLESGQLTALTTEKDSFDGNVRVNMAG